MAIYDLDRSYLDSTDEINWTDADYALERKITQFNRSIVATYKPDCPHRFLENELFELLRQFDINPFECVTNIYYAQGSDIIMNFNGMNADMVIPAIKATNLLRNYLDLNTMPLSPKLRATFTSFADLEKHYNLFLKYTKEAVLLIHVEDWEIKRYGMPIECNLEYVRDMQSYNYPDVSINQLFQHTGFDFRFWGIFHTHPAVIGNTDLIAKLEDAATIVEKGLGFFFKDFFNYLYQEHSEHILQKKQTAIEASFQKWAEQACANINITAPVQPNLNLIK